MATLRQDASTQVYWHQIVRCRLAPELEQQFAELTETWKNSRKRRRSDAESQPSQPPLLRATQSGHVEGTRPDVVITPELLAQFQSFWLSSFDAIRERLVATTGMTERLKTLQRQRHVGYGSLISVGTVPMVVGVPNIPIPAHPIQDDNDDEDDNDDDEGQHQNKQLKMDGHNSDEDDQLLSKTAAQEQMQRVRRQQEDLFTRRTQTMLATLQSDPSTAIPQSLPQSGALCATKSIDAGEMLAVSHMTMLGSLNNLMDALSCPRVSVAEVKLVVNRLVLRLTEQATQRSQQNQLTGEKSPTSRRKRNTASGHELPPPLFKQHLGLGGRSIREQQAQTAGPMRQFNSHDVPLLDVLIELCHDRHLDTSIVPHEDVRGMHLTGHTYFQLGQNGLILVDVAFPRFVVAFGVPPGQRRNDKTHRESHREGAATMQPSRPKGTQTDDSNAFQGATAMRTSAAQGTSTSVKVMSNSQYLSKHTDPSSPPIVCPDGSLLYPRPSAHHAIPHSTTLPHAAGGPAGIDPSTAPLSESWKNVPGLSTMEKVEICHELTASTRSLKSVLCPVPVVRVDCAIPDPQPIVRRFPYGVRYRFHADAVMIKVRRMGAGPDLSAPSASSSRKVSPTLGPTRERSSSVASSASSAAAAVATLSVPTTVPMSDIAVPIPGSYSALEVLAASKAPVAAVTPSTRVQVLHFEAADDEAERRRRGIPFVHDNTTASSSKHTHRVFSTSSRLLKSYGEVLRSSRRLAAHVNDDDDDDDDDDDNGDDDDRWVFVGDPFSSLLLKGCPDSRRKGRRKGPHASWYHSFSHSQRGHGRGGTGDFQASQLQQTLSQSVSAGPSQALY